jgi:hypothetical protein
MHEFVPFYCLEHKEEVTRDKYKSHLKGCKWFHQQYSTLVNNFKGVEKSCDLGLSLIFKNQEEQDPALNIQLRINLYSLMASFMGDLSIGIENQIK